MADPHREGRWGIRQLKNGEPTGGGTVFLGWETRADAEASNPPKGEFTYEAFARWEEPNA